MSTGLACAAALHSASRLTAPFQKTPVVLQQTIDNELKNSETERSILKIEPLRLAFGQLVQATIGTAYDGSGTLLISGEDADFSEYRSVPQRLCKIRELKLPF